MAVREPPASKRNRSWSRASICCGDKTTMRAAASSMARGIPSRRRQMDAMALALSSVGVKAGSTALRARRRVVWPRGQLTLREKPMPADPEERATAPGRWSRLARSAPHGSWRQSAAAATHEATSERARRRRRSGARSCPARAAAHGGVDCRAMRRARSALGSSRIPRTEAIVCGIRPGTESGVRSTNQTPSGNSFTRVAASRKASRVFPTPPAPTRVNSGDDATTAGNSWSSFRRPTKLVSSAGRLWRVAAGALGDGSATTSTAAMKR